MGPSIDPCGTPALIIMLKAKFSEIFFVVFAVLETLLYLSKILVIILQFSLAKLIKKLSMVREEN